MNVLRGIGRNVHFEGGFLTFLGLDKGVARFGARICTPLRIFAVSVFPGAEMCTPLRVFAISGIP